MAKNGLTANEYRRLIEKLHRLAYELDYDAGRLRASCPAYAGRADSVKDIARRLGNFARHEEYASE